MTQLVDMSKNYIYMYDQYKNETIKKFLAATRLASTQFQHRKLKSFSLTILNDCKTFSACSVCTHLFGRFVVSRVTGLFIFCVRWRGTWSFVIVVMLTGIFIAVAVTGGTRVWRWQSCKQRYSLRQTAMAMREKTTSIVECNHDNVHMDNCICSVCMLYIHIHIHIHISIYIYTYIYIYIYI